jgi:hypothetical protein
LQEHLYGSSFIDCDVDLWHWLDELTTANVKLIFKGLCGNVSYTDNDISISIIDRNQIFKNEYRNSVGESFYSIVDFPSVDPDFVGRPIRKVFGYIESTIPVNIDYVLTNPTTSDNRVFIVTNDETNLGSVSTTVPASPSSTTTRTYLTSSSGFRVGDSVWIDSSLGAGFDEFVFVTGVGANYIDHTSITNVAASTDVVKRSFVGNVNIFKNNILYKPRFGRDFLEYTDATNRVAGFTFSTNLEVNLSIPSNITPQDLIYCRAYGHKVSSTIGGNPFGSNSSTTNSLTNGVVLLYDVLKTYLGLSESEINTTQFTSIESTTTDEIGFALPSDRNKDFPKYSDIITEISKTLLLRVFLDSNNKWSISKLAPLTTPTKTIQDDEVLKDSFNYFFDYSDIISDSIVAYNKKEVSDKNEVSQESFSRI